MSSEAEGEETVDIKEEIEEESDVASKASSHQVRKGRAVKADASAGTRSSRRSGRLGESKVAVDKGTGGRSVKGMLLKEDNDDGKDTPPSSSESAAAVFPLPLMPSPSKESTKRKGTEEQNA